MKLLTESSNGKRSAAQSYVTVFAAVLVLVGLSAVPSHAQSISGLSVVKNAGNSANEFSDGTFESYERTTSIASTSTPTSFTVHYSEVVGVDEGLGGSDRTETQASDYTASFNVTAPRGYLLTVSTQLKGALDTFDDGSGAATADVGAVTGSQTGGTIQTGTLSLLDPGIVGPTNSTTDLPFNQTATATICGVSNGASHGHTLHFTWSASCRSQGALFTNGDECAVRLGLAISYSGETAGDYPGAGGRTAANDGHFINVTMTNLCGNGVVDSCGAEQCDDGPLNGTSSSCCNSDCTFKSAGSTCRAAAGLCDVAETCNGTNDVCPTDHVKPAGTSCRAPAGDCDAEEFCDGTSTQCPADNVQPAGTLCRGAAGECDAPEFCTGGGSSGITCPADQFVPSGTTCTSDGNPCTLDQCNGSNAACQHPPGNAGAVCRSAAGECDQQETCTGASSVCPTDIKKPSGTSCTSDGNPCSLDQCDGSNNTCQHPPGNAGAVCRSSTGECDPAETCTGASTTCPGDMKSPSGTSCSSDGNACTLDQCDGSNSACQHPPGNAGAVCRSSAGECDPAETCTGASATCPSDVKTDAGTTCTDDGNVCTLDQCDGTNAACQHPAGNAGTECRAAAGDCDQAEFCDGSNTACPVDDVKPVGTLCRGAANDCDQPEFCSGAGSSGIDCPADAPRPSGFACGDPSSSQCDSPDTCDGAFNCLPNHQPVGQACGSPASTDCTSPDTCDGNGACLANDQPSGHACGNGATTDCSNPDTCNGTGTCLPNDQPSGHACGSGATTDCSNPDTCNGTGTCLANDKPAGTSCGDHSDTECTDPDTCNGSGVCQPNNAPNGTACADDGETCTTDACNNGVCAHPAGHAGTVCRPSTGQCDEAETCDGTTPSCPPDAFQPDGTPCDDSNSCTAPDQCSAGACIGGASTQCLDHYKCYKAKDLKVPAKFAKQTVTLQDQFGTETGVKVIHPAYVCNPVDVGGSGINNPVDHLVCYKIKGSSILQNVQTVNELGTLKLRVIKGKMLCVPATKTITP